MGIYMATLDAALLSRLDCAREAPGLTLARVVALPELSIQPNIRASEWREARCISTCRTCCELHASTGDTELADRKIGRIAIGIAVRKDRVRSRGALRLIYSRWTHTYVSCITEEGNKEKNYLVSKQRT